MITFEKSCYLWALRQVDLDLQSEFAVVKGLQTSMGNRFLTIIQELPDVDRERVWKALLKRFHSTGSVANNDGLSSRDIEAIMRYDRMCELSFKHGDPSPVSASIVSKSGFQTAAHNALKEIFKTDAEQCGGRLLRFVSSHRNCSVHTYLDAGSRNYQLCYWQNVIASNGELLREKCSVLELMGIASQTFWVDVTDQAFQTVLTSLVSCVKAFVEFCDTE